MDRNAFSQINLSKSDKLHIVVAWMIYIREFQKPVPHDDETVSCFIQQSGEPALMRLRGVDAWLQEHVARLF